MNGKRVSTNVKLAAIIHANAEETAETEAEFQNIEKLAKMRLQRACLYGGGARTLLPKTKKSKKPTISPFTIPGAMPELLPPQPIMTSIPPGAHEEQFRLVRNPTRAALNDPDRYCYNTTRMDETIKPLPQPPWYVGYGNKIDPPDSNMLIASARYGYRGSRKIQQYNTKLYEMPSKTRTEYTPKFLHADDDFVDEYVPPILAATINTVNGLETPKLWPENTEYVEGYKKKKLPTSWKYKRETTVDLPERPKSPDTLSSMMERVNEEQDLIRSYAKMESQGTMTSAPIAAKQKFDQTWQQTINKEANSTLKMTMKKDNLPHESHTLMDPSDALKYSGSTAMIVHSQSTDELKFRLRMERSKSKVNTPYQLKWQHVIGHYKNIENKLKRNQNMTEVIKKIADTLQEVSIRGGSETSIRRAEFVQACSRISYFEDITSKLMSQLYSLFDPMKKDMMRFAELLFMFLVLNRPEQEAIDKLLGLWRYAHQYGLDRNMFDIAFELLTCCAVTLSDVAEIEKYYKTEFRAKCYEFAIKGNSGNKGLSRSSTATGTSRPSSTPSASADLGASTLNSKKSSFVQHQYNICESYLNDETFPIVLASCPELIKTFDAQMSARLISCYGKDDRHVEPENEAENLDGLDFSWIMKREAPKREVFGLF